MRLLYGLDNLPRDPGNLRLPAVEPGPAMLRLNSLPLPSDLAPVEPTHAARVAVLRDWLLSHCGDYARDRRRLVGDYLAWADGEIARHRATIAARLARFDGLYAAEDFFWSAPRPLPRAWLPDGEGWRKADVVFWDGARAIEMDPGAALEAQLPEGFQRFWESETLPMSPFRRPFHWGKEQSY